MTQGESCLVSKLSHYCELDQQDTSLLARLEENSEVHAPLTEIHREGDRVDHLYVVKSGWLYSYTDLPDGGRLVVRIHHPGDMLGLDEIPLQHHSTTLASCNEVCLCPFRKSDIDEILVRSPRLTALMFALSARDHVVLVDTLRAVSRMRSPSRIAFFVLDLISRLRITNPGYSNSFRMPLTQSVIGDAIGLSNVSVSRTWSRMEEEGLLGRDGDEVHLLNEPQLVALCDFVNRYKSMDTLWFPDNR